MYSNAGLARDAGPVSFSTSTNDGSHAAIRESERTQLFAELVRNGANPLFALARSVSSTSSWGPSAPYSNHRLNR